MNPFIEIRTFNLKPGTRDQFHRLYIEEALPRLQRWNFDVAAHGPSLHDENEVNNLGNRQMGGMGQAPFLIQ